ncbi:MAG: hypothetical protein CMJ61_03450 [Planctomycetaceae bacterium]|nr:hypothetical protein [Planctomycetaceae bacterium]
MSTSCMGFRQQLEALLGGRPDPERLTVLGWHEHLLSCGACREILEQEEALELLLASLPDPQLPPDLSRRLVRRLRQVESESSDAKGGALESLLALDEVAIPTGLVGRVKAGVAEARREDRLDALLERALRVEVPEDLGQRVLAGLEGERSRDRLVPTAPQSRPEGRTLPMSRGVLLKLAAAILVGASGVALWRGVLGPGSENPETPSDLLVQRQGGELPQMASLDEEVIENLSELLYWESIESLGPMERDLLSQLDLTDEAVLDSALEAEGS